MTFRLDAQNIALTYPQCNLTRDRVLGFLQLLGGDNYQGAIVAQERHADGNTHIHAYLRLRSKRCFRDPHTFDIDGFHANIQGVRNARNWCNYCRKEDQHALVDGDIEEFLRDPKSKQRVTDLVASRIESGATAEQLYAEFPGFYLMNKRKIEDMMDWMVRKRQRLDKLDWEQVLATLSDLQFESDSLTEVRDWLVENIRKPRKLRQKQLWLQGPPASGKTSLVQALEKYLSVFWVPMDGDGFVDGYSDEYDLIVFDEMKSQFKLTWLNQFIVGSTMSVNVKGAKITKVKNLPVMFLTNYGILSAYSKNTPALEAFMDRLQLIHCTSLHPLNQALTGASPVTN